MREGEREREREGGREGGREFYCIITYYQKIVE
jgi:hypothetical protein